jgi:hypothetical protein
MPLLSLLLLLLLLPPSARLRTGVEAPADHRHSRKPTTKPGRSDAWQDTWQDAWQLHGNTMAIPWQLHLQVHGNRRDHVSSNCVFFKPQSIVLFVAVDSTEPHCR